MSPPDRANLGTCNTEQSGFLQPAAVQSRRDYTGPDNLHTGRQGRPLQAGVSSLPTPLLVAVVRSERQKQRLGYFLTASLFSVASCRIPCQREPHSWGELNVAGRLIARRSNVARVLTRDWCTTQKTATMGHKQNPAKRTRAGSKGRCSRTGPGLSISSISLHPPISPDQLETSSHRQPFTAGNGSTATPRSAPNIAS